MSIYKSASMSSGYRSFDNLSRDKSLLKLTLTNMNKRLDGRMSVQHQVTISPFVSSIQCCTYSEQTTFIKKQNTWIPMFNLIFPSINRRCSFCCSSLTFLHRISWCILHVRYFNLYSTSNKHNNNTTPVQKVQNSKNKRHILFQRVPL